jgi:hypothetical protein
MAQVGLFFEFYLFEALCKKPQVAKESYTGSGNPTYNMPIFGPPD